MKNSNDTIGNRTRDLPTCSTVPQPTVPRHAPGIQYMRCYKVTNIIKAKGKGGKNLELEMSSSHMPYKGTAVTAAPVHATKAYKESGGSKHLFFFVHS